jgi:predicted small lipoprotein YifL
MRRILILSVASVLLAAAAGCNHGGPLYLAVVRPVEQFPPNVKSVAVLPFAPKDAASSRYSEMASKVLSARLDDTIGSHSNQPSGPVTIKTISLMDFSQLPGLAGADLADPATGAKAAKSLNVDAALCGVVTVVQQDRTGQMPAPNGVDIDPATGQQIPHGLPSIWRIVTVTLEVRLVQAETGQLLLPTKTLTGTFDSGPVPQGVVPPGPPMFPSMDDATGIALSNCVTNFSGGSSGLVACVVIELAGGKSHIAKQAREYAVRGQFPEAARRFSEAISERPDDHGSIYNLGVMKLFLGDLPGGMGEIAKALQLKGDKLYKTTLGDLTRATAIGNVQVRAATPAERLGFGVKSKSPKCPREYVAPVMPDAPPY